MSRGPAGSRGEGQRRRRLRRQPLGVHRALHPVQVEAKLPQPRAQVCRAERDETDVSDTPDIHSACHNSARVTARILLFWTRTIRVARRLRRPKTQIIILNPRAFQWGPNYSLQEKL